MNNLYEHKDTIAFDEQGHPFNTEDEEQVGYNCKHEMHGDVLECGGW